MLDYQEPEPMEFEYTSPNSAFYRSSHYSSNEQRFTPPKLGSFPVPESFFENKYNRTTAVANKIADDFMSFTLNDPEESIHDQGIASTVTDTQAVESNMVMALYSPPLSPQQPTEKTLPPLELDTFTRRTSSAGGSTSSIHSEDTRFSSSHTSNVPPVEQKGTYNAHNSFPTPKLTSSTIFNHAPNYNPSFIHSPHYTPSYTYYYEQPKPADPLAQSHGTLHFIQGLFKLIIYTVIFGAGAYVIFRFCINFSHDMVEKMDFYESDSINTLRECRNAYESNRCDDDILVPAIVDMCLEWERCMFRPVSIKRSRAFAETVAEMANGFSEKLTTKTMFMSIILGIALIWAFTSIVMGHPNAPAQAPSSKPSESEEERRQRESFKKARSKIETLKFEPESVLI